VTSVGHARGAEETHPRRACLRFGRRFVCLVGPVSAIPVEGERLFGLDSRFAVEPSAAESVPEGEVAARLPCRGALVAEQLDRAAQAPARSDRRRPGSASGRRGWGSPGGFYRSMRQV